MVFGIIFHTPSRNDRRESVGSQFPPISVQFNTCHLDGIIRCKHNPLSFNNVPGVLICDTTTIVLHLFVIGSHSSIITIIETYPISIFKNLNIVSNICDSS